MPRSAPFSTVLRGARTHNLKGVDLDLRPGEVVMITGPSGSGKSSLALDTLHAEGLRRYVESFSPYARQFLERLERPPVDRLDPVPSSVAVDRRGPVKSSRSTLASLADLSPWLSALFLRESAPHCPEHLVPAEALDAPRAAERALACAPGALAVVTRPLTADTEERYLVLRERLAQEGWRRLRVDGADRTLDDLRPTEAARARSLELVVDRVRLTEHERRRLAASVERAWDGADGLAHLQVEGEALPLRRGLSCPRCARAFAPPAAGLFSAESPLGACGTCRGFGRVLGVDLDKVIPDPSRPLGRGAVRPWTTASTQWEKAELRRLAERHGIPWSVPWRDLAPEHRRLVIDGDGSFEEGRFPGVRGWFRWLEGRTYKMHVRVLLARYRSYDPCPECQGRRLRAEALLWRVQGLDLPSWNRLTVQAASERLEQLAPRTSQGALARRELASRLGYLRQVGLGYLTLDRPARTLSGGEAQRVTLTAALGTSLHHTLFVLDEPSVGLHPSELGALAAAIRELARRDNTVLVVEHDPALLRVADRVIELGRGAGAEGGEVVADGPLDRVLEARGATARALSGLPGRYLQPRPARRFVELVGARAHDLRGVDARFPLGAFTVVTGRSGSGKSTLAVDTLYRAVARRLGQLDVDPPGEHDALRGVEALRRAVLVDQAPLGRTSRGNPATYTGAWDHLRRALASTEVARARGWGPGHFSFNVAGGLRCDACAGEGSETVEMQFLADVRLVCPACQGRRFREEALEAVVEGRNVAQWLDATVQEVLSAFPRVGAVRDALGPVSRLGLGYLRLGQPLGTLSGGEAQRLKLARALGERAMGALFVLDEPSAGLHVDELRGVLHAVEVILASGGTVVAVDHDPELVLRADWVVELGPGAGKEGGTVVAQGPPDSLRATASLTGELVRARATREARSSAIWASPADVPQGAPGEPGSGAPGNGAGGTKQGARRGSSVAKATASAGARRAARRGASAEAPVPAASGSFLEVVRAREHTLQEVSVRVPHGALTVVTGPSGSGKSSLAHDVIFAEGQRRFLETLSPYARQFLPVLPRPDVDAVLGLAPAIALEQRTTRAGPLSTVATLTEVAQHLRLLFARCGVAQGAEQTRSPASRGRGVRRRLGARSAERGAPGSLEPGHFSHATAEGRCPRCEGRGVVAAAAPEARGKASVRRGRRARIEDEASESPRPCPDCEGTRLGPLARGVRVAGASLPWVLSREIGEALAWAEAVSAEDGGPVAQRILGDLGARLRFLVEVGLGYLTLDRAADTLSGGELQRLRLGAQLGAGLSGAMYVVDEPTIGLHPQDTRKVLDALRRLTALGSTVLVVEHDLDTIRAADHLIDMGPGGGREGGRVMAVGPPAEVLSNPSSPTAAALRAGPAPRRRRDVEGVCWLEARGITAHNLRGLDLRVPLGRLTVVAGVSGSGKSTLVRGVLLPAVRKALGLATEPPLSAVKLSGLGGLRRALSIDQSPIGRTPRSVPATYLGIWDAVRRLYASSPEARVQGFGAARFSFNTGAGGRCETCEGQGSITHEMSFLPDAVTPCPACQGRRFEPATREVRWNGLGIGEVLELSASEAALHFAAHPEICAPLAVLDRLGAGYLRLGQSSLTLSGGEAQRLKLATELAETTRHEPTLYVLDEPTTGLHQGDVRKLVGVLDELLARGDTLVVIEHHPELFAAADWLVELGPGAGREGGRIVAQGTPRDLATRGTPTGEVLAETLGGERSGRRRGQRAEARSP